MPPSVAANAESSQTGTETLPTGETFIFAHLRFKEKSILDSIGEPTRSKSDKSKGFDLEAGRIAEYLLEIALTSARYYSAGSVGIALQGNTPIFTENILVRMPRYWPVLKKVGIAYLKSDLSKSMSLATSSAIESMLVRTHEDREIGPSVKILFCSRLNRDSGLIRQLESREDQPGGVQPSFRIYQLPQNEAQITAILRQVYSEVEEA